MTEILPKRTAGIALGLVNGVGNLGGVAGPYVVGALKDHTQSFAAGFFFLSGCLVAAGLLMLLLGKPAERPAALQPAHG